MMPLPLQLLTAIPWGDQGFQNTLSVLVQTLRGTSPEQMAAKRLQQQLDLYRSLAPAGTGTPVQVTVNLPSLLGSPAPAPVSTPAPASSPLDLDAVVEQVTVIQGNLKEAQRFAREDGPDHPEVLKRVADAQEQLDVLERHTLRPEALAGLPPEQRQAVEAMLPTLRRIRQGTHQTADGRPVLSVGDIDQVTAGTGQVLTQLRVLRAVQGQGAGQAPYSRYAPDMERDTGCLPCGRAHLGALAGTLDKAAKAAREQGMASPDTQAALQTAQEESAMVLRWDWTPERIAQSPPEDQRILRHFAPQVESLYKDLNRARTPEQVERLAKRAKDLRTAFLEADRRRPPQAVYRSIAQKVPPEHPGDHRVHLRPWAQDLPGEVQVGSVTMPTDSARMFDRLANALQARGVRIQIRNLPTTEQGVVEAHYIPDTNTIQLGPAALAKDFYAVQTLAHEAAHALTVSPECAPAQVNRDLEEQVAEDASLAAMLEAGLPVELVNGEVIPPGTRTVDWGEAERLMDPAAFAQVQFAVDWITRAMGGAMPQDLPQGCPRPIPASPKGGAQ